MLVSGEMDVFFISLLSSLPVVGLIGLIGLIIDYKEQVRASTLLKGRFKDVVYPGNNLSR